MNKFLLFLVLSFSFSNLFAQSCEHSKSTFSCVKYVKNYDADTITVDIPGVHPIIGDNISVRVSGIDAPEIRGHGPCEKEASRNAKRLVENLLKKAKRIDLLNVDKDKYFRLLADVKVDGVDLKSLLLKNNLAYQYAGGTKEKRNWCGRGVASKP
jgi:micrococcal nuclease